MELKPYKFCQRKVENMYETITNTLTIEDFKKELGELPLCACGCGKKVKITLNYTNLLVYKRKGYPRYILGHNIKSDRKNYSKEAKNNILLYISKDIQKNIEQLSNKDYQNNPSARSASDKRYYQKHKEKRKAYQKQYNLRYLNGDMSTNKECPVYLGIYIAENVLSKIFDGVTKMPYGNKGYDFICKNGYKIDVKCSCIISHRKALVFNIKQNKVPDYFLCMGFENRDSLNPIGLWLFKHTEIIRGMKLNEYPLLKISLSKLNLFNKYKISDKLDKVKKACDAYRISD